VSIPRISPSPSPGRRRRGRVLILGEHLCSRRAGPGVSPVRHLRERPLVASQVKIIADSRGGEPRDSADSAGPAGVGEGPFFEVAAKLADEIHPVANPAVDQHGGSSPPSAAAGDRPLPTECPCFGSSGRRGGALPQRHHEPTAWPWIPPGPCSSLAGTTERSGESPAPARPRSSRTGWGWRPGIAYGPGGTLFVGDRTGGFTPWSRRAPSGASQRLPASVAGLPPGLRPGRRSCT